MLSSTSVIPGTRKRKILELPQEMLVSIFKYLPVNERKAVRLVCKLWFEVCAQLPLANDEVITCHGCYKLSDTYDLLNKSQRKILNLKFDQVKFTGDSSFWQINGSKIHSLTLNNCQLDENVMDKIIYSCDKLFHLAITYTSKRNDNLSFPDLARVSRKGIVRENLQSLEIRFNSFAGMDRVIRLFTIFPKLKELKMYFLNPYGRLMPVINEYLMASKDRIEKLEMKFKNGAFPLKEYVAYTKILTDMKRLKKLTIDGIDESQQEIVEKFIHSQPLESLEYYGRSNRVPLESFLQQLNSSLKHLKLSIPKDLVMTRCLHEKLTSSTLKSCHLDIDGKVSVQDLDALSSYLSAEQRPATSPSLTISIINRKNSASVLQSFPNLHHLKISYLSSKTLQSLLKYQKKLKSLIVRDSISISVMENYAFNQLSDIVHLELDDSVTYAFLKSLSSGIVFTKLKYLKINLFRDPCAEENEWEWEDEDSSPESEFLKLTDAAPYLEALYINEHDNKRIYFINLCTELCTKLSQLRFLRWDESEKGPVCRDGYYRGVFAISPSLRVLQHHRQCARTNKYFLDTLNGKVTRLENGDDLYTLAKPKIGGFSVGWLTF